MSDENRFFRFVWRFNALALALGLAAITVVGSLSFVGDLWGPIFRAPQSEPVGHFAPVPKEAERNYTYRLESEPLETPGTRERIMILRRWEGEPREYGLADVPRVSSYSGPEEQDVNILVIDGDSGASHWLFGGYCRSIISRTPVYGAEPDANRSAPPVVAWVMQTVDADTNKDGKLTTKDRQSLYVYRPGAGEAVKFLSADNVLATHQIGADKYLIVYENGKTASAATYSVPDFKLLSQKSLQNVPK